MLLEQINRKHRDMQALRRKVDAAVGATVGNAYSTSSDNGGRVLGLRVPPDLAQRLARQQERRAGGSFASTAIACLMLGVEAMEAVDR